jgi:hypothetical protein
VHNNPFTLDYSVDFVGFLDFDEVLSTHRNMEDKNNFNQLNPEDLSHSKNPIYIYMFHADSLLYAKM